MPTGVVVSEPSTPNPKEAAPAFLAGTPVSGAYAPVAALLHESRRQAPDELGRFLARRVAGFGMREVSVYISDFEQRRLVPIAGSAEGSPIDMEGSIGEGASPRRASSTSPPVPGYACGVARLY
jgi:hypothetical protein